MRQIALDYLRIVVLRSLGEPINVDLQLLSVHLVEVFAHGYGELRGRHRNLVREQEQDVVDHSIAHSECPSRIEQGPESVREIVRLRALEVAQLVKADRQELFREGADTLRVSLSDRLFDLSLKFLEQDDSRLLGHLLGRLLVSLLLLLRRCLVGTDGSFLYCNCS